MNRTQQSFQRSPHTRGKTLTPLGWITLAVVAGLGILILGAGVRCTRPSGQAPPPTPAPTAVPPTPTAPPPAPVVTEPEVAFPAYWTEGMYQDDAEVWWPAEDVREELVATIKAHYLEGTAIMGEGTETEVLETVTDEMARRYQTGPLLDAWFTYRKRYEATGQFNELIQIVDDSALIVYGFSEDGLRARIGETYMAAHLLQYDAGTDTWTRIDIPEDGLLDGTQYLGVAVLEMQYDQEDGRWKKATFEQWVPRPAP